MKISCTLFILAIFAWPALAQHGHLDVGARGRNQSDQLVFANGDAFVDSSGYVKTLVYASSNRFAGYYEGNISLTALSSTLFDNSAAPGSFIQFGFSNVSGPPGGAFGFWDTGTTAPSESLLAGQGSSNLYILSESDGSPGSDPFGHIHGRRFTATHPGVYKIAFKAYDTSTNGTGGGPVHTPTDWLPLHFQAGINIVAIARTGLVSSVRYGSRAGYTFTLEYTTNLTDTNLWLPAAVPQVGDDYFQSVEDPAGVDRHRFYRMRSDPIIIE